MHKRVSTDTKLASMINANTDEAETREIIERMEKLAKQRLRRACLYGGGARTRIPHIKKIKKQSKSPFAVGEVIEDQPLPKAIDTSDAPNAHNDMYRLVQNNTTLARNDPDRVCYNSSSMLEGLRAQPQPAWYVGYNNAAAPSDGNVLTASVRYGFRGSKNMLQYMTKPYEMPSKTRNEHTPQFLQADADFVDEYVPPVLMTTANTINNMEAPRLWPENTEYVTGYPKKKLPTMWKYKRETTVDLPERPASPPDLSHVFSRMTMERQALLQKTREERHVLSQTTLATTLGHPLRGTHHSDHPANNNFNNNTSNFNNNTTSAAEQLPHFQATWRDTLQRLGSASLKRTLKEDAAIASGLAPERHYLPSRLVDPTDRMRYSGSTAFIVHSQTNDELSFRFRMERVTERCTSPQYLQWSQINSTFDSMSRKLKRGQTMAQTIDKIATVLHEVALRSGSETSIRRVDFVTHMSKLSLLGDDASAKTLSHLYSTFDPVKKNALRFVELLLRWKVLVSPEMHLIDKFRLLWLWVLRYGADRSIMDRVVDVLSVCCGDNEARDEVERLYREEFKPSCLQLAVLGRAAGQDETLGVVSGNTSTLHTARPNTSRHTTTTTDGLDTAGHSVASPAKPSKTVRLSTSPGVSARSTAAAEDTETPQDTSETRPSTAFVGGDKDNDKDKDLTFSSSSQAAFHVAEHFLANLQLPPVTPRHNKHTHSHKVSATYLPQTSPEPGFMLVLRQCPKLLQVLDRLLHERLVHCYGKDERRVREEAEREREMRNQAAEKQDFSWIINQSAANRPRPARAVLSLFGNDDE